MSTLRCKVFGYDIILTTHSTHNGYETSVCYCDRWWDIGPAPCVIQTAVAFVEGLNITGYEFNSRDKWMILKENYKNENISNDMRQWADRTQRAIILNRYSN